MSQTYKSDVRAVLCETNPALRAGIQAALFGKGIREVVVCKDAEALMGALSDEIVDLVVCDIDIPGMDFCDVAQRIRQNRLGRNPFALIIATVSDSSLPRVRRVINAGVDRVVRKPMPMHVVIDHVSALTQLRKPFVATDSYVGPSRRATPRAEDGDDHLMPVPNTMHVKATHRVEVDWLEGMIKDGVARVQAMKARNIPMALTRAIGRVNAYYQGRGTLEGVRTDLDRMVALGQDLIRRNRNTASNHLAELGSSLISLVMRISADLEAPQKVHLVLLHKLGEVLDQAARIKEDSNEVVHEIAETVGRAVDGAALNRQPS